MIPVDASGQTYFEDEDEVSEADAQRYKVALREEIDGRLEALRAGMAARDPKALAKVEQVRDAAPVWDDYRALCYMPDDPDNTAVFQMKAISDAHADTQARDGWFGLLAPPSGERRAELVVQVERC